MSLSSEILVARQLLNEEYLKFCKSIPSPSPERLDGSREISSNDELSPRPSKPPVATDLVAVDDATIPPKDTEPDWDKKLNELEAAVNAQVTILTQLTSALERDTLRFQKGCWSFSMGKVWLIAGLTLTALTVSRVASVIKDFHFHDAVDHTMLSLEITGDIVELWCVFWATKISFETNTRDRLEKIHQDASFEAETFKTFITDLKEIRSELRQQRLMYQVVVLEQPAEAGRESQETLAVRRQTDAKIAACFSKLDELSKSYLDSHSAADDPNTEFVSNSKDLLVSKLATELPISHPIRQKVEQLKVFKDKSLGGADGTDSESLTTSESTYTIQSPRRNKLTRTPRLGDFESLTNVEVRQAAFEGDSDSEEDMQSERSVPNPVEGFGRTAFFGKAFIEKVARLRPNLTEGLTQKMDQGEDGARLKDLAASTKHEISCLWGVTPTALYTGASRLDISQVTPKWV